MIERYATKKMQEIWSEQAKLAAWLEVEKSVCRVMAEDGKVPAAALAKIEAVREVPATRVLELEKDIRHDVLSFLSALEEQIGSDSRFVHQGMTSNDLLDTALAIQLRQAGEHIVTGLSGLKVALVRRGR